MDGASKGILETEFGTSNEDECIKKILENGEYQSSVTKERQGGTNDAKDSPVVGR